MSEEMPLDWNGNLDCLYFGVEQEHFVFKDGRPPSGDEIESLFGLLHGVGYEKGVCDSAGKPLGVRLETDAGNVTVKSDFCTHILEVAFPPMTNPVAFVDLYKATWSTVTSGLAELGMRIRYGGALDAVPDGTVLRCSDTDPTGVRLKAVVERRLPEGRYSDRLFNAAICATQVHLNVVNEAFYGALGRLYALEYLIPLLFSQSKQFRGYSGHCVRPLIYRDNFDALYRAYALPDGIPSNEQEYRELLGSCPEIFHDYSFIAPTAHGSAEFRSGCSQPTVERVLDMVTLRIAIFMVAHGSGGICDRDVQSVFYEVCESGAAPQAIVQGDLAALRKVASALPAGFRESFARVAGDLEEVWSRSVPGD